MRSRRSWLEIYAKDVLGTILEFRGQVIMEHEIVERRLRADMLFVPEPARRSQENLGIVERMVELGQCIIELFGRPPSAQAGFDCVSKHLAAHGAMRNQARRNRAPAPPRPRLWMISPGRPRSLIADMNMQPMHGWPTGFWHVGGTFHVHLIVVRDLPVDADTLPLRLLDTGKRLERAMAELDELPQGSRLRQGLAEVALAWRQQILETSRKKPMMSPETKARYEAVKNELLSQGRKEGRSQGRKAAARAIVRKLLTLRFGKLPADAEQRLRRGSLAELERWAERVLTAKNLAAIFAD
jgi:hypothetical protein